MKKKKIRNILIAVAVVVVIAAAVILTVSLRKDGHGLNAFERAATAASAKGEKVSMIEYVLTLDTLMSNSTSASSMTDEQLRRYQESAAKQALMVKLYTKEAKSLGLKLTDEEVQKSKDAAQAQIDAVVENYTKNLISNGSFSKATLNKQIANYYAQIGMNQSRYYSYIRERTEASYYMSKLQEYYRENGSGLDENEVLTYYRDSVKESMANYEPGNYSLYTQFYTMGYMAPMYYVPEGFIYVDFIRVSKDTEEEVKEILNKVEGLKVTSEDGTVTVTGKTEGESMTFDELKESDENKDSYRTILKSPYAIGEDDVSYLVSDAESGKTFFEKASALEIGEIDSLIVPVKGTAEEGEEAPITGYTGYIFRRAEGNMCEEGDSGIIKIDYYDGVRESMEEGLREEKWLADIKMEDGVYAYKGIVE